MMNTPIFVDDMKSYTTYDQHSIDAVDDYKPPYNVRTRWFGGHLLTVSNNVICVCFYPYTRAKMN